MKAILTFHSIDQSGSVLSFPRKFFADMLAGFCESGISVTRLDQLLGNKVDNAVAITFDDGMRSVYTDALPVLQDFDAPAHLFLTTGLIGKVNFQAKENRFDPGFEMLDWSEIEKLHAGGVLIEGHTDSHPDMRALSKTQISDQCELADGLIAQRLGRSPRFFAYPFGYHNAVARAYAGSRYIASVTTELSILMPTCDPEAVPRLDSYYLQAKWLRQDIFSPRAQLYLRFRSKLRNLRGSQCPAGAS